MSSVHIATKDDLIATHRIDLDSNCEVIWMSIEIQGAKQILIGSFYTSQNFGNFTDYLDQLRESLSKASKNRNCQIYLGGISTSHVLTGLPISARSILCWSA